MELFKRFFCIGFFKSQNREIYRTIAVRSGVSSFRVYRIAHGKRVLNSTDKEIFDLLREKEIILKK